MRPQSSEAKQFIQERFHSEVPEGEMPPLTKEEQQYLKIGEQLTSEWIGIPKARALFARFEQDYPEEFAKSGSPRTETHPSDESNVIPFPKVANQ